MKPHLFAVVVLAACSARGPALTVDQIDNIALLYGKPNCEYESMGTVTGGDGHHALGQGAVAAFAAGGPQALANAPRCTPDHAQKADHD